MKYLILLLSSTCFAGNYISPSDLQKIHNGDSGYAVYTGKSDCGPSCVDIDGIDPETHVIQGGILVIDPLKAAQKAASKQAKKDAKDVVKQKRIDAKVKLKDLSKANSVPALREQIQAIKDILGVE